MSSIENEFLASMEDVEQYRGKWIAILDREVIAAGEVLSEVYKDAVNRARGRTPLFEHIPATLDKQTLIL